MRRRRTWKKSEGLDWLKVIEEEWIYSNEDSDTLGQVWLWCGYIEGKEDESVKKKFLEEENYR